jgi:hypothetical protein
MLDSFLYLLSDMSHAELIQFMLLTMNDNVSRV